MDILLSGQRNSAAMPIGLDFGTTNTVLSYYSLSLRRNGVFVFELPTLDMNRFPSMVYQENENTLLSGIAAYANRLINPELVALCPKKRIGDAIFRYSLGRNKYSSIDIASEIVKGIFKEVISTDLEFCPSFITATVPYHFKNIQNSNTLEAINHALFDLYGKNKDLISDIKLIPEPLAATIYYIYQNRTKNISNKILLTYDIGGGTLDFTLLRFSINRSTVRFEVLASDGLDDFGGNDFDELIYQYVIESNSINLNVFSNKEKRLFESRVKDEIIKAKHRLSHSPKTQLIVPNLPHISYINCTVTRNYFELLLSGQLNSKRNFISEFQNKLSLLIKKTGLTANNVDTILPIGGGSQVPLFLAVTKRMFPKAEDILVDEDGCFSYVSKGAAIYSAILSDKLYGTSFKPFGESVTDIDITSRIPHSIFIEKYNGALEVIIPENSISPYSANIQFLPTVLDSKKDFVKIDKIKVFQGTGNETSSESKCHQLVGSIDFTDKKIHVHKRDLSEILINITVHANETLISFSVNVKEGNINKTDLIFDQQLFLN